MGQWVNQMKSMIAVAGGLLVTVAASVLAQPANALEQYTIDGEFDGCEYGKLYALVGGGVLECQALQIDIGINPLVIADGRRVLMINEQEMDGTLHDGQVITTRVSDDFDGCDYDKVYNLDNGLLFQCSSYHYHYAYRPEVKIMIIDGRKPTVLIAGYEYRGQLFRK